MSLRNIVLSLMLAAGCGGNTTGSNGNSDGGLDCKVNCMLDGGNNKKDGNGLADSCCNYDGRVDGIYDGYLDGNSDSGVNDGSTDAGINDGNNCSQDGSVTYPRAVLACTEWADDCLCVHRLIAGVGYCWDASGSQAGPGRTLVGYRIYFDTVNSPDSYISVFSPEDLCGGYTIVGEFLAKLRVIDDLGEYGEQPFYNIISED